MTRVSVAQAKANFRRLLAEAEAGRKKISDVRAGIRPAKDAAVDLIRRLRDARY